MMVYCTLKNHVFGLCPSSNVSKKKQCFGNWICFQRLALALSKGPNTVGAPSFYLRMETDPVSKTFFLETLMDKVQKHDSSKFWNKAAKMRLQ
jgi:hypothetical protein